MKSINESSNDRDIIRQILDYDEHMNKVETLVDELRHFASSRINYRSDLYLTNDQVKIILDALKQVYGVG